MVRAALDKNILDTLNIKTFPHQAYQAHRHKLIGLLTQLQKTLKTYVELRGFNTQLTLQTFNIKLHPEYSPME
jgi:hypothetical protein